MGSQRSPSLHVPPHFIEHNSLCGHKVNDVYHNVETLAAVLDLPDVTTRAGKKQILEDLEDVCWSLTEYCTTSGNDHHKMAAVALTLLHISADSVLNPRLGFFLSDMFKGHWHKLFNPHSCAFGMLIGLMLANRMVCPPANFPAIREALYTNLRNVAHRILVPQHRNTALTELCVITLGMCIPMYDPSSTSARRDAVHHVVGLLGLPKTMSAPAFAQFFSTISHTCLAMVALDDDFSTPVLRFLIGTSCAADAVTRRRALSTLTRMANAEDIQTPEASYRASPPVWNAGEFLENYYGIMNEYSDGEEEEELPGECHPLARALEQTAQAMCSFHNSRNAVQLGLRFCELTRDDALSVAFEPTFSARLGFGKRVGPRECGFPFDDWRDSLLHAAQALENLPASELLTLPKSLAKIEVQHAIDLLLVQHAVLFEKFEEAAQKSRVALARVPDELFFRYGSSLHLDSVSRTFRDAYDCHCDWEERPALLEHPTRQMTARNIAVAAFSLAMVFSQEEDTGPGWETVGKLVTIAHDFAGDYMSHATVTSRDLPSVRAVHFLTACIICRDIRDPRAIQGRTLERADEAYQSLVATSYAIYGRQRSDEKLVSTMSAFLKHGAAADAVWGSMLRQKCPTPHDDGEFAQIRHFQSGDHAVYASWWTKEDADVVTALLARQDGTYCLNWSVTPTPLIKSLLIPSFTDLRLRKCAYCSALSSLLKKCSACRDARYCSADCQRKHWRKEHRELCSRAYT